MLPFSNCADTSTKTPVPSASPLTKLARGPMPKEIPKETTTKTQLSRFFSAGTGSILRAWMNGCCGGTSAQCASASPSLLWTAPSTTLPTLSCSTSSATLSSSSSNSLLIFFGRATTKKAAVATAMAKEAMAMTAKEATALSGAGAAVRTLCVGGGRCCNGGRWGWGLVKLVATTAAAGLPTELTTATTKIPTATFDEDVVVAVVVAVTAFL
mmetsp:Transcript_22389/g.44171  ORF Transcript_22389/g.44171 Transcript_22389/m.44171 type:complete len:212 (+) Transcript_22389:2597-3232(+)